MHRIDAANTVPVLPAPRPVGTPGFFSNGNPPTQGATVVDNDWFNSTQEEIIAVIAAAGIALDKTNNAQLLAAIRSGNLGGPPGRLIGMRVFNGAQVVTYNPASMTPASNPGSIVVEVQGAGGAGGGAVAAGGGAYALGTAGTSGAYGVSRLTSGFVGQVITVGAKGLGAAGANGTNGGTSSFGSLLSCPGGVGGSAGPASSTPYTGGNSGAVGPTGANLIAAWSQPGGASFALSPTSVVGGYGGASRFGGGGTSLSINPGNDSFSPGAGGGGASNYNSASTFRGGNGADGIVIIWEYA